MAYRMKGFSGFGNSPLKQGPTYEQIRQLGPKPTGTKGASEWWKKVRKLKGPSTPPAEKTISQTKEILKKDIKKVKGKTIKIKTSDIVKKLKSTGSKLKLSQVKKALGTSIKAAGKIAKFVPGVGAVITAAQMMTAKSASADQPGTGTHGGTKTQKLKDINK